MRQAGKLATESEAARFADYLLTLGIESKLDADGELWTVWILDENRLAQGREELTTFAQNPDDARYAGVTREAERVRRETRAAQERARRNVVDVRGRWNLPGAVGPRPLCMAIMLICIGVAMLTQAGRKMQPIEPYLFIAKIERTFDGRRSYTPGLQEIRHGQLWRLFTPCLIHFGLPHLVLNLAWLFQMGGILEARRGAWRLAALMLVAAAASNVAQYGLELPDWLGGGQGGPYFGGFSGVGYALFGYVWIKSRFDPAAGIRLNSGTVFMFLLWFAICIMGFVGPIANVAHAVGLLVGMAWAFAPLLVRRAI